MKLNLGRKIGLFHCHIRKIQKLIITKQIQIYKKHYGDGDSTKKLQSFISIVVPLRKKIY